MFPKIEVIDKTRSLYMWIVWRAIVSYTREWHQLVKYDPSVTSNQTNGILEQALNQLISACRTNGILIMRLWFWNWEIYSLDAYIGEADISEVNWNINKIFKISMKANHNTHTAQQATVWKSWTSFYHPLVQFQLIPPSLRQNKVHNI